MYYPCIKCQMSHDTTFRKCQHCRDMNKRDQQARRKRNSSKGLPINKWQLMIVRASRRSDYLKNRTSKDEYITPDFLERLRKVMRSKCSYCRCLMQVKDRSLPDGLTIQRLDNTQPHSKNNCTLACHKCNVRRVESTDKEEFIALKKAFTGWKEENKISKITEMLEVICSAK